MKQCIECKKVKYEDEFSKFKSRGHKKIYTRTYCKECQRLKFLKRLQKHGCERNYREREQLAKATRPRPPRCEACNGLPTRKKSVLDYDHNHATDKFRGWICNNCNRILGFCHDNPLILLALVYYLKKDGELDIHANQYSLTEAEEMVEKIKNTYLGKVLLG